MLEGLERIAEAELQRALRRAGALRGRRRPGALRFSYAGELADLLTLRSVVAVYGVQYFAIPRPKGLLGNQQFGELSGAISAVIELAPPGAYATLRLSAAGEDSSVLTRLKEQIAQRFGLAVAADEGDLLIRLRRARGGDGWETLVRLTPRPLATRAWRVCNWPGALNASLAYAMIALTEPAPGGCGAERGLRVGHAADRAAAGGPGAAGDRLRHRCGGARLRARQCARGRP